MFKKSLDYVPTRCIFTVQFCGVVCVTSLS